MRVQPQYPQHLFSGKKEPGECNLRWGPLVGVQSNIWEMQIQALEVIGVQSNIWEMQIQALEVIVVISIIHLRAYYYLQKKRMC